MCRVRVHCDVWICINLHIHSFMVTYFTEWFTYSDTHCLQTSLLIFKFCHPQNKRTFVSTANKPLVGTLMTTRRSKIVSRAIATSVEHLPCAAVSFNFTGQSVTEAAWWGWSLEFWTCYHKTIITPEAFTFVKPLCTPLSSQLSPRMNSIEILYVVCSEWKAVSTSK